MDAITSTIAAISDGSLLNFQSHYLWALIVAFHLSFIFAFFMGANEVSNAFATSVGSGAISLRMAYLLATFVESAGGILLGYKVLETLRFKIIDLDMYENSPDELLLGQVAILGGSAMWMMLATFCGFPVSSTHSHVGSIIGFSLLMRGFNGLHIWKVVEIIISWIVSPILSGIVSAILYIVFDIAVLRRKEPLKCGFRSMPIFYFFVFTFNTFMVVYHGSKWIGFDKTPFWLAALVSLFVGVLAALIFQFLVRPYLVKWVQRPNRDEKQNDTSLRPDRSLPQRAAFQGPKFLRKILPDRTREDHPQTLRLFSAIQVFTGCFTGFSHGSKDIPNTIAPLANLLFIFSTVRVPSMQETPLWILAYGALGTCVGFWMMGHKVIGTVGKEFTEINPFGGFTVELGAAITVLCASKLGIPVSMTLCIVGSIVAVGAVRGKVPVNWALFRNVLITWVVTFPLSGLFSAALMFILKLLIL
ncbi:phosphate transporter family domain-containing protein [Ditylenchus destructor]|nr:phosphate transporter family domain-containing protein [Ditylenchus destructor]